MTEFFLGVLVVVIVLGILGLTFFAISSGPDNTPF